MRVISYFIVLVKNKVFWISGGERWPVPADELAG